MIGAVIAAAGKGLRAGFEKNKLLMPLGEKTVLEETVRVFAESGLFDEIVIVASETDEREIQSLFPAFKIVRGGATRTQSVLNGLRASRANIVLVHDGARPYVTKEILSDCIESVKKYGSGIAAYPATDTVARAKDEKITEICGKENIYILQTPQGFYREELLEAYEKAPGEYPDESSLFAAGGRTPRLCKGSPQNCKLTFREDFGFPFRVGNGYDTHPLVQGRDLILCGVKIPHDKGLLGHSDADAPAHALTDALLSAAGLRDIGTYFPDTDEKYKGANSLELLRKTLELVKEQGYVPENASVTILAQRPKLAPYIEQMRRNLANVLAIPVSFVGISATTTEKLGFIGREEGIASYASVLLKKNS